jgi:NADH dehydrogenase
MRVLLTGASGYVGSYVLRALCDADVTVRCLTRRPQPDLVRSGDGVERVLGDVTDLDAMRDAVRTCDAVIHLVGIIDEKPLQGATFERVHVGGTRTVVAAARDAGVPRFLHMSANGARPSDGTAYQTTKWRAEQIVEQAGFAHWTIVRPSVVFGKPDIGRPEFAWRLLNDLIRPFPVLPVFGSGDYELQPVHVTDIAQAFVQALDAPETHGQTYVAAGPTRLAYVEALDRIAEGAGLQPKPKAHVPVALARLGVNTVGRLGLLPISPAQFEMLLEGNTGDASAFYRDFDIDPTPFTAETLAYLRDA